MLNECSLGGYRSGLLTNARDAAPNVKVVGSNPNPATNKTPSSLRLGSFFASARCQLLQALEALWKQAAAWFCGQLTLGCLREILARPGDCTPPDGRSVDPS